MKKHILVTISIFLLFGGVVFATDSIIQNITDIGESTNDGGYNTQKMFGLDTLKFINLDNDGELAGDYFVGDYYDPAHGVFSMNNNDGNEVRVSSNVTSKCPTTHTGYKLEGYSYNPNFGFMDFNINSDVYVYICIPKDFDTSDTETTFLGGYAYSHLIGFQAFDGWEFDSSVDICGVDDPTCQNIDDYSSGRLLKVEGNIYSQKYEESVLGDQLDVDVRILGNITKSSLRKQVHANVYRVTTPIKNADELEIFNEQVLFYKNPSNIVPVNNASFSGDIRTIVVDGGNVKITENLINFPQPVGIIVLGEVGNDAGNIYIESDVTDIHATLFADKSILSMRNNDDSTFTGTKKLYTSQEDPTVLKNQLFIKGTVFSENTLGGSYKNTEECPYYVKSSDCSTKLQAQRYDMNFLRRYKLVQPVDNNGQPVGSKVPQFGGLPATTLPINPGVDYNIYPVIIEYDSRIQENPPVFLK